MYMKAMASGVATHYIALLHIVTQPAQVVYGLSVVFAAPSIGGARYSLRRWFSLRTGVLRYACSLVQLFF